MPPAPLRPPTPPPMFSQQAVAPVDRQQIGMALLQQVGQKNPDYGDVFSLIQQRQAQAAPQARPLTPAPPVAHGKTVPVQAAGPIPAHAGAIIALAQHYVGLPYKWGGTSPKTGFDCSGFVQWLYGHAGIQLPRTSQQQWSAGHAVARGQLRAGDLVFFEMGRGGPGHVGLYIGGGKFIESPHTGASIRVSSLAGRSDYAGARRVG